MASNDKVQMELLKAIQDLVKVNVSLQEDVKTLNENLASQTHKLAQMDANQHQVSRILKGLIEQVQAKNEGSGRGREEQGFLS